LKAFHEVDLWHCSESGVHIAANQVGSVSDDWL
jgi:hypothetical protein